MKIQHLCTLLLLLLVASCTPNEEAYFEAERPHEPWVFRSVMDAQARMITIALHDNLWASYSAETGALYKVWKGSVNFDGAVYTTVHGPQPSSLGNAWFENTHQETPFSVQKDGKSIATKMQYKGHRYKSGQVSLNYELQLENGTKIAIAERPEYVAKEGGQVGFERRFTTANVPSGMFVVFNTNIGSISLKNSVETDGEWTISNEKTHEAFNLKGIELDGELMLKSNDQTTFTTYFTKKPLYENKNKVEGAEEEEERPLGYRLIARNDCKTCHNTNVKTIGPSYMAIAQKYRNTPENVATLSGKVKNGGSGIWGETMMSAHADLPDTEITAMVDYIMSLDAIDEAKEVANEPTELPKDLKIMAAAQGINDKNLLPGVMVNVFISETDLNWLKDVDFKSKPVFTGVLQNIQAEGGDFKGLEDDFAMSIEGYLNIPKDNNYVFRLISDDGSRLNIGDTEVILHDGGHGMGPMDGEMALAKGLHPFKVEYFQGKGGKGLILQWRSFDDKAFKAVPATAFVHDITKLPKDGLAPPMAIKRRIPGDGYIQDAVHPSYDLSQARPAEFTPKVGGMDFLDDGRLVISTWDAEGNVYVLDNVQSGDETKITATKIATGLAEPLGLKVVDNEIYVLQKQELTKLIDHNGDGTIDEYKTIANSWTTTANFHEFAFGLEYQDGYFYNTLAIGILPGGASANPQAPDRGKVIKINKETGAVEFVAHGLRTPNGIGEGVDGEIFVADNQGDWLPASKILHITKDAFFNSYAVERDKVGQLEVKQPVVWLPQDEIGNSPSTPSYLNDGPYKGQMIHGEVTNGGVKRVFVEKIKGEYQGCVFRFIQGLEAGVNRLTWGPDGALYVGGIGSTGNWRQNGKLWYGLQRLKYNEKTTFEMLAVRAKSNGIEIEFTEALPENTGWNTAEYDIKQWYYLPTKDYGGPKMDNTTLNILSANVSTDRKKVFLELEGMKEGHVVYVHLPYHWTSENGGELWSTEAWYTLNNIPENAMGTKTAAPAPIAVNTLSDSEKAAGWKLLFDGKTTNGWRNFRKETIGKGWIIDNDAIHLNAKKRDDGGWQAADGGDIITNEEYENYELFLEWKIGPCGNSGIIYNVIENENYDYVWQTGPEMQVLDNVCHPDAKFETHRAGDLYDMIACKYVTVNPSGQWNKIRLKIKDGYVEHWQNGRKVVEFQMWDENWDAMVKNSKFYEMKGFGTGKKGHISLQDHGDPVWYRNIKIREL